MQNISNNLSRICIAQGTLWRSVYIYALKTKASVKSNAATARVLPETSQIHSARDFELNFDPCTFTDLFLSVSFHDLYLELQSPMWGDDPQLQSWGPALEGC